MNDLVSVVITTYKRSPEILLRAIRSVLEQSYEDLELIIVNDYPEKSMEQIIREAVEKVGDNRVKYYVNETNKGACFSRNFGVSKSSGKFIAFLDDDDAWKKDKLERHLPFLEDEKVGMVYAGMENHYNGIIRKVYPSVADDEIFPLILLRNCIGGCSIPVIRKDAFLAVGGYDEAFPAGQDMDLWIRICKNYKVVSINDCLTEYYYSDVAITRNLQRQLRGLDLIIEKYADVFAEYPSYLPYRRKREVSLCIEKGDFAAAKKYYELYRAVGGNVWNAIPDFSRAFLKRVLSKLNIWKV